MYDCCGALCGDEVKTACVLIYDRGLNDDLQDVSGCGVCL